MGIGGEGVNRGCWVGERGGERLREILVLGQRGITSWLVLYNQ